jgi:hypothetical protein
VQVCMNQFPIIFSDFDQINARPRLGCKVMFDPILFFCVHLSQSCE